MISAHQIDTGSPLILGPFDDSQEAQKFAVEPRVCDNPECPCTEMKVEVYRLEKKGEEPYSAVGVPLHANVSSLGDVLGYAVSDPDFPQGAIPHLQAILAEPDTRSFLSERWRRRRGQVGDPNYPDGQLPPETDRLIRFFEAFPSDYDLSVHDDGQLYYAEDMYCLAPGCGCDDVTVAFRTLDSAQVAVGHAVASIRQLNGARFEGQPVVRDLWQQLVEDPLLLSSRFASMHEVARERLVSVPERSTKVARNAPCPCGSGKKFKRCCALLYQT